MDVSASAIAELNDKRKFDDAAASYKQMRDDSNGPILDAAFHFQGFLAYSMSGGPVEVAEWWLKACPDYDKLMEADLWRDTARQIMRQKWPRPRREEAYEQARSLLENAASTHADLAEADETPYQSRAMAHYLADISSLARLNYVQGEYGSAYDKIAAVIEDLNEMQNAISTPHPEVTTYLRNAAFDGLRAATQLHLHRSAAYYAKFVTTLDPSGKKRWAAKAIRHGGRPGLAVVERFFR